MLFFAVSISSFFLVDRLFRNQLPVSLLTHLPLVVFGKNCDKDNNKQQCNYQDKWIKVLGVVGLHHGPFVPSGNYTKRNRNGKQQACRNTNKKKPKYFFLLKPVSLPVIHELSFLRRKHINNELQNYLFCGTS